MKGHFTRGAPLRLRRRGLVLALRGRGVAGPVHRSSTGCRRFASVQKQGAARAAPCPSGAYLRPTCRQACRSAGSSRASRRPGCRRTAGSKSRRATPARAPCCWTWACRRWPSRIMKNSAEPRLPMMATKARTTRYFMTAIIGGVGDADCMTARGPALGPWRRRVVLAASSGLRSPSRWALAARPRRTEGGAAGGPRAARQPCRRSRATACTRADTAAAELLHRPVRPARRSGWPTRTVFLDNRQMDGQPGFYVRHAAASSRARRRPCWCSAAGCRATSRERDAPAAGRHPGGRGRAARPHGPAAGQALSASPGRARARSGKISTWRRSRARPACPCWPRVRAADRMPAVRRPAARVAQAAQRRPTSTTAMPSSGSPWAR